MKLSPRELQILGIAARGYNNQQIADELNTKPQTVKNQIHSAMRKLGAKNRTQAVMMANRSGLIKPGVETRKGSRLHIMVAILKEYDRAVSLNGSFNSAHEGLGVIWEEFEELKAEVFKKKEDRSSVKMTKEATHLAAMAMRFINDICKKEE